MSTDSQTISRPILDTSADRAKTPIEPGFDCIGTLRPRSSDEIESSNWTLGCETLDRDYAIYDEYKEFIVPLGIKTIRLQGGWAKTEKQKGVYDFAWLDAIIDDAVSRHLNVLLETGYGNSIYDGGGGWDLHGGFPTSEEALAAWDTWVTAMAQRYKGKVRDWAMWNEPDSNPNHTPRHIVEFNIRTTEIIKRIIPDARIAGLSLATPKPKVLKACLEVLDELGKVDLYHWFINHGYNYNPDSTYFNVKELKDTLHRYSKTAKMRQGENGCPSELTTKFALGQHPWTEISQSKWNLRRMLGDLGYDVECCLFTMCDFNHTSREINRKGLVRANEQKQVIDIKHAYYAAQNLVSVFDDALERLPLSTVSVVHDIPTTAYTFRKTTTDECVISVWENADIPGEYFDLRNAQMIINGITFKEPVWCDLLSGKVYKIPLSQMQNAGEYAILKNVPLYDSPILIAERNILGLM